MIRFASDVSGGWRYHLRAQRGHRRWAPFRQALAQFIRPWLSVQEQTQRPVLLIGPSGGYTLPWPAIRRCAHRIAIEPDPIARFFLARRDPALILDQRPALGWSSRGYCPNRLHAWFDEYEECAMLFCNLLGQLDAATTWASAAWRDSFVERLSRCDWLSFHDLVSCNLPADLQRLRALASTRAHISPDCALDLWEQVFAGATRPLHLVDHATAQLFSNGALGSLSREFFSWQLCPDRWHVIEGLVSATNGRGRASSVHETS